MLRVVVVTPELEVADQISAVLAESGGVVRVASADEALEAAAAPEVNAVVVTAVMAEDEAVALTDAFRARGFDAPVVFVTETSDRWTWTAS